jgi:hypothetical protein
METDEPGNREEEQRKRKMGGCFGLGGEVEQGFPGLQARGDVTTNFQKWKARGPPRPVAEQPNGEG